MQWKKSHPGRFDAMTPPFQVQPDWYEKYWLTPERPSPSTGGRWYRTNPLLRFTLYAAIVSMFVYFGR